MPSPITAPSKQPKPPTPACGAKNRSGAPCQKQQGWGTDHFGYGLCKLHGGSSPNGIKNAAKIMSRELPIVWGMPEDTDQNEAIMRVLRSINGSLSYADYQVRRYSTPQELALEKPSDVMLFWLHARAALLAELRATAKIASDMGVSQRRIDLEERMGDLMGDLIAGVLNDIGLTPLQLEAAQPVVRRHLELVAGRVPA